MATSGLWILGSEGIAQTMGVSSGDLSTTMSASQTVCPHGVIATGAPVDGVFATGDCLLSGYLADRYEHTTTVPTALAIAMSWTGFGPPRATVSAPSGAPSASGFLFLAEQPFVLLAAPGTRVITARTWAADGGGAYTLSVTDTSSDIGGCRLVFIERGVTTTQQIDATDCESGFNPNGAVYFDEALVYSAGGSEFTATLASTAVELGISILDPEGNFIDCQPNSWCRVRTPGSGFYTIRAYGGPGETGAYTLTIE